MCLSLEIVRNSSANPSVGVVVLVPVAHAAPLSDPGDSCVRSSQLSTHGEMVSKWATEESNKTTYHNSVFIIKEVGRIPKGMIIDCRARL